MRTRVRSSVVRSKKKKYVRTPVPQSPCLSLLAPLSASLRLRICTRASSVSVCGRVTLCSFARTCERVSHVSLCQFPLVCLNKYVCITTPAVFEIDGLSLSVCHSGSPSSLMFECLLHFLLVCLLVWLSASFSVSLAACFVCLHACMHACFRSELSSQFVVSAFQFWSTPFVSLGSVLSGSVRAHFVHPFCHAVTLPMRTPLATDTEANK